MSIQFNEDTKSTLKSLLKNRVTNVFASLVYGAYAGGYADERSAIDILAIVESDKTILKCWSERVMDKKVRLLTVDRGSFESDIRYEHFGGILSENLVTPYYPIIEMEYLKNQEIKLKKSIIKTILRNLILGFPEMSRDFLIKSEYFMYEYLTRRSTLFPPISYRFLNFLMGKEGRRNVSVIMEGFNAAVRELISDGILQEVNGDFIKISEEYVESVKKKRAFHLLELFNTVRANIIRQILGIFPEIRESLLDEKRIYREYYLKGPHKSSLRLFEDPRRYLFIPTALGIMPFTEKFSIESFISRYELKGAISEQSIKRLGGVLNSVYLLKISGNTGEKKVVAKVFKDWYDWKWFPIALWTIGARNFAVLGRTRLEKEYAINRFLSSQGINVPAIIYANPEEKIIIQEHVEGTTASKLIKQLCKATGEEKKNLLEVIRKIGCEIAKIHRLGVSIGDCKPENIVVAHDGRIFFIDLEQAERGGDQAWDIAEFLYYSGHYVLLPLNIIEDLVKEFLNGYVMSGGSTENIKRALSLKYIRVFSFFTPPHIILTVVNLCRNLLK